MDRKSVLAICIAIILGFAALSSSILFANRQDTSSITNTERYEITAFGSNLVILDKNTGEYWQKYIMPNQGPTNWEKQQSPVK